MKMEQTECSETSACKIQMPGNYPEERIQYSEHGISLKSRILEVCLLILILLLGVEMPDLGGRVVFPSEVNRSEKVKSEAPAAPLHEWTSLDPNTQQQLLNIIEQDTFTT